LSCVRGLIELGRVLRVAVNSCVLEREEIGRTRCVRSVIWGLY
jgi:hypothetical protein